MSLIIYKAIAALLIFFISIATALYPLKKKIFQHAGAVAAGEAVASGIFLGAAFFHLLPDSIRLFQHVYGSLSYPLPEAICAGGFLLLLFLERIALKKPSSPSTSAVPLILATILIIHAVIEGAALGIGATLSETVMLFIAILAHKGSESFALCIALLRHQIATRRVIMIILFFALMTPLGIALGAVINHLTFARDGELAAAVFNACAAGTFLYISTLHHIHFHKHARDERQGLLEFICLVSGTVVMGVIALWT